MLDLYDYLVERILASDVDHRDTLDECTVLRIVAWRHPTGWSVTVYAKADDSQWTNHLVYNKNRKAGICGEPDLAVALKKLRSVAEFLEGRDDA